jgi:menaquinone-dependent protoporphyrinogen oxidase
LLFVTVREVAMKAGIFYATREGQGKRVAEHVAESLRACRCDVEVCNVRDSPELIDTQRYQLAFVVASVHLGHHEREILRFVKSHRADLVRLGAPFLSLTLSEAGAEDPESPPEKRMASAADAQRMIDVFVQETGWRPAYVLPVAGALTYSKYNFFIKLIMKNIARKAGGPTDTSRDYEFTDWDAVDRFVLDRLSLSRVS